MNTSSFKINGLPTCATNCMNLTNPVKETNEKEYILCNSLV